MNTASNATAALDEAAESKLLARLARIVGDAHLLTDAEKLRPHTEELRGRFVSECLAVALPADAAQVAAVITACAQAGATIVPQGGNTGAVGGAVARRGQIIVNLARMNRILDIDADNYTMEVEAGCILADIQDAAAQHDRLFPLSLGAQGSCQIGGNLATNAGGINVLRYGNARDLVLGVQVALADGNIWSNLNRLRKNNSGYDLKHLFIGAEGTLGIITAATLKLFPPPRSRVVALAGLRDADAALALLNRLRDASDDRLAAFELMARIAVQSAVAHIHAQRDPMRAQHAWYALIVADSANADSDLHRQIETCLASACADDLVQDAVIASNESQAQELILLRERIVEAQNFEGGSIKHDVSVPVSAVPEFLRRAHAALTEAMPDARAYPYGHMGDGNMHFNISQPLQMDTQEFLAQWDAMNQIIHKIATDLNGSFSAEHGIGIAKLEEMKRYKDETTLALYRRLKGMLDPDDVLNPGKVNPA